MNDATSQSTRMTQAQWRELSDWPLTGAAVVFLAAYAWQVLGQPTGIWGALVELSMWSIWVLFAIDFVINIALAPAKWRWFFRHFHEFLIVVLPLLRPLRLLRLVSLLAVLQVAAGSALRGRVVVYAAGSSILLISVSGLAIVDAERGEPDAMITTFGDGLWWALVTITTVGYGDLAPVTLTGRLIATGLMVAGIALLGTVTAMLASWFLDRVSDAEKNAQSAANAQLEELTREVRELRAALEANAPLLPAEAGPTSRAPAPLITAPAEGRPPASPCSP